MKYLSTVVLLVLTISFSFAQTTEPCENPILGASCNPGGSQPEDGNGSLGMTYNNTACGLNYVQSSVKTTLRYATPAGTGFPTTFNIAGIPACATIVQAYVWWGGSGSGSNPSYTFNGAPANGTLIGSGPHKCWSLGGTLNYRADVTASVPGNGAYTFSSPHGDDMDGATLMVIYSDPNAIYQGTIQINDGDITDNGGGASTSTMTGLSVCANSSYGEAFLIVTDMQDNLAPPTHTNILNGANVTFPNLFYNFDMTNTNFTTGQTTAAFGTVPDGLGDCYDWMLMGIYYQTTTCVVCSPPPGMTSAPTFADATCGNCDGTATMNPVGGATPYTFSWNTAPVQTTQTATGLCAGVYIGTAIDASGCLQVSDTITVGQLPCACSFTGISVSVGACNPNSTYDITGTLDFINPPTTGTLTITNVCSGNDTTINAPFVSPFNWSLSGLPTGTGTCDVTAVFSADPACTISLGPANEYPVVPPCGCVANIGTFNTSITPNNGQSPYILCFGDQFTINSNGDNVDPGLANNPPGPAYNPGIGYLIYSCPPTIAITPSNVFPNDNIANDPCFVGFVGFGNSFNDVNNLGSPSYAGAWTNNTIYYVPITFYDTVSGTYSYVNTNIPCYSMGQPYAVQYLTDITTVAVPDCQDSSVTITVTGGLPEADGSLYTASNLLPANASFVNNTATHGGTIVINGLQNGDMYSFDIVDANGCPSTVTGGPFVGLPNANAGVDDTSCTLTYNLNAIVSFGTGAWTGPAGVVFAPANSANATVSVPAAGVYNLTWTEDNTGGCTSSDNVTVLFTILTAPVTPIATTCFNGTDGQVVVAPQGGTPAYTYLWDAAAGNQITNPATGLSAGNYSVTVTDAFGCTITVPSVVTEPTPFTYTTTSINANCGAPDGSATVVGFAGGTPGYTYDWGAGPQASNTLNNLIPGIYTVIVTDVTGICDTMFDITVGNNAPFTALITGSTNASCNGVLDGTASADGTPANPLYTYSWNTIPVQNTQTATGLGAGTYTVTVTDPATGCTDDTTITITEPPLLTVNAGADVTICTGGNTNLSANGAGGTPGYTYTWDNGLGAGQNQNVSPTVNPTTYIVTIQDANLLCTAVDAIIVNISPPLAVVASADDSVCPGFPANISALATAGSGNGGPYTYTWGNGLGAGQNQSVSPTVTTTYIVTVGDGCTSPNAIDSVTIYIKPVPVVDFLADKLSVCQTPQEAFEFYNMTTPTGGTTSWMFGDGNGASGDTLLYVYTGPGSYDVTLTVTGLNGCTVTVTKPNYVTVYPNPTADFTMNPNPATMFDPTINFFDQSYSNIVSWAWDIGGLDSSIIQNPIYLFPADTGNYVVTLTVVDVNGCTATISNVATVLGEFGVYVPNAFTPDGDGMNDGFFPNGFGITQDDYAFMIFDRWGELLYESHKTFEPWDGTYKGKLVQNGVYVWRLKFQDINGEAHTKIGHVTIVK
jgi:gliding motility-associated-like protein